MSMLALKGIYKDGVVKLNKPFKTDKPLRVIITFIDEDVFEEISDNNDTTNIRLEDFSFLKSIEESNDFKGALSESLIEERRENL